MTKALLLLAALTLCCCMASLHASSRFGCKCIRKVPGPIPYRLIKSIEISPITGGCRRVEAFINKKDKTKVCVNPMAPWFIKLVERVQSSQKVASSSITAPPTASPPPTASD